MLKVRNGKKDLRTQVFIYLLCASLSSSASSAVCTAASKGILFKEGKFLTRSTETLVILSFMFSFKLSKAFQVIFKALSNC